MSKASYVVVHTGARRGYAVPEILAGAGMLDRFYTDASGSSGIGRASALLRHMPIVGDRFRQLYGRKLPPSIVPKTWTFDIPALQYAIGSWRVQGDSEAGFRFAMRHNERLGCAMMQAGFGQATHVYSMLGEGGPYLKEAKRRGLTVVSEVYIVLAMESILIEERQAFAKWEPDAPDYRTLRRKHSTENVLIDCSDFFICPSNAVQDDLTANWGVEPSKTAVVPYGVNADWLQVEPRPIVGRVLFVGTAELRKGIHYFAMAAAKLKARRCPFEFAVAGNVSSRIAALAECRYLNFLGRIPRNEMHLQYQSADVFVLPSLAEGSAESIYEAMACGLPIVTTPSAGSVVRDGVDGLIVPERDSDALAEAIAQIVEDRNLRERMSIAARERARDYTWVGYGQRLIETLNSVPSKL